MGTDLLRASDVSLRQAYIEHERGVRIQTGRIACALVFFLMPLGSTVDFFVYRGELGDLFLYRVACSVLVAGVWLLHSHPAARRRYPLIGLPIVFLPALFMCLIMLHGGDGAGSSYYASLNLIILAVSTVGHWTVAETVVSVILVIILYLLTYVAGFYTKPPVPEVAGRVIWTHVYFILLTGLIATCGNYLFNRLRMSEFRLRWELDLNQRKLAQQKEELVVTNTRLADTVGELESRNQELAQTQAQLVQAEKMASLGRMSAGIAHEINNPLNFVKMNLFTLRKKGSLMAPEQQPKYLQLVDAVEDGVNRVRTIVSDLRTFSHPVEASQDQVEVAEVVASALRFLSADLTEQIDVHMDILPGQTIWANKNKLIQVVLNILQNSVDAVRTKQFQNGERPGIWITGRVEHGKSQLVIRDNGPGIPPEHRPKIYDPFFTTKEVGEGMGLGLSICYGIVEEFEGKITDRSEPGIFCEFTLEFPLKGEVT